MWVQLAILIHKASSHAPDPGDLSLGILRDGKRMACSRTWTSAGPATFLAAAEGIELALLGNRFRVTLSAVDPRTGNTGVGQAMPQGDRFGYFSLPSFTGDPAFPEIFVRMTHSTGSFGLHHTGLTDLEYVLTVTDSATGAVRTYKNDRSDPARLCGGADIQAFHD